MSEFISAATAPVVFPLTLLLGLILIYWITVILGVFDIESFDLDLDTDGIGLFNFGDAPLAVVVSLAVLFTWEGTLLMNRFVGLEGPMSLIAYGPGLLLGYLGARLLSKPVGRLMRSLNKSHAAIDRLEAKMATLLSDNDGTRTSQARIDTESAPILLSVKAREGTFIAKGTQVLIIDRDEHNPFYYVEEL